MVDEKDAQFVPEQVITIFDRVVEKASKRENKPKYPCGISTIDNLIFGYHEGEVCTVAARPSDGKSSFLLQSLWFLANLNIPVLCISLEMSKEQMVERLFSHEMQIDNQVLRRGGLHTVEKELMDFSRRLTKLPIYFVEAAGYTIEEIEKILKYGPSVKAVFLDYLQLIRSGNNSKRNYEIGQYLRDFRNLSKKKNFCLITLAQIHRAVQERTDKRPMLHDLKDSGDIEQDSDTVMMLYWNCNNEKESDLNKYEIIVAKQRNGQVGRARIKFHPQFFTFSDY